MVESLRSSGAIKLLCGGLLAGLCGVLVHWVHVHWR